MNATGSRLVNRDMEFVTCQLTLCFLWMYGNYMLLNTSVCLPTRPSCLFVCMQVMCIYACLPIRFFLCLYFYLIYISICPSVWLSMYIALYGPINMCFLHVILSPFRHYATSRNVAGSIPDKVIVFFNWPDLSSHTMALVSTQPVPEMSTRTLPGGG
jgi:hypothetical protein